MSQPNPWGAVQVNNFRRVLAPFTDPEIRVRVAFCCWTESRGVNWANDGTNTSHSQGFGPNTAAILRTSLNYPHDAVGSNGRSTGLFQQTSSEVGGAWGGMAGTMIPEVSAARFVDELTVTDNRSYRAVLELPNGGSEMVNIDLDPIAADTLRVQGPQATEAKSDNYNDDQVSISRWIVAQFPVTGPDGFVWLNNLLHWSN